MRKFTTKRGFTIVEILVAFVIFAIMAAMISTLLMTINKTKRENLDIEEEIEAQRRAYYLSETDMQYDLANKEEDSLSFSFDNGNDPFTIDYEIGGTTGAGYNLQYPVGSVDYSILTEDALKIEDNNSDNKGGQSVTARYDTRIYGDEDLTDISVKLEYYGPYNGGHLYMVYSNSTSLKYQDPDTGKDQPYRNYSQYRIVFPSPIMEYGYFRLVGSGDTQTIETIQKQEKDESDYKKDINENGYDIYCPVNKINLICDKKLDEDGKTVINGDTLLYGGIIRVASEQRAIRDKNTSYFEYNGEQFYVVLEDKLAYDSSDPTVPEYKRWNIDDITTIFGTNGVDTKLEQDGEGRYVYTHYNDSGNVQQNIFGAYPVKDYDPSTPSTPKK